MYNIQILFPPTDTNTIQNTKKYEYIQIFVKQIPFPPDEYK